MPNSITASVLADVRSIDKWCYDHPPAPVPASGIAYVSENQDLLLCLMDGMARLSQSQLRVLQHTHPDLDQGVASPDFFSIPREAIKAACELIQGNQVATFTTDDVHMIRRAMEYALYADTDDCDYDLRLSPVQLPR